MDLTDAPQFACPVCSKIPSREIYQCKNGHTICHLCSITAKECSQCNELYGKDKIRNLALEEVLDSKTFDCPNKDLGCSSSFNRAALPPHMKTCEFRVITAQLCQLLGYNCNFTMDAKKGQELFLHLAAAHNVPRCQIGHAGKIIIPNFLEIPVHKTHVWTPVILEDNRMKDSSLTFMTIAKLNGTDQTMSFISVMLDDSSSKAGKFAAHYVLRSDKTGVHPMEWTTPCICLRELENAINLPAIRIPANHLRNYCTKEKILQLFVVVKVNRDKELDLQYETDTETAHIQTESSNDDLATTKLHAEDYVEQYEHFGLACDGCQIKPIKGTTHICLQCRFQCFCDKCRKSGVHSHHFCTEVRNKYENAAIKKLCYDPIGKRFQALGSEDFPIVRFFCAECKAGKVDKEAKYFWTCKICSPSYSLCSSCHSAKKKRTLCVEHPFMFYT